MIVLKKALPRRTFLRGMGVTLSLPLLDAMVPALTALAQTPANPIRRLGCLYAPNGYIAGEWVPTTVGTDFALTPSLAPLAPFRNQTVILSGLAHMQADSQGDGNGDHPRATAAFLSGVHAWATADGVNGQPKLGTTLDQVAADVLGKDTPLRSLELGLEVATQISCDAGDCFYANTISWRTPTTPLSTEAHPRVVFERLFGDASNAGQRLAQMHRTSSILDSITEEVADLERTLGSTDRSKLTEYVDAVRDVEQRVQIAEKHSTESGLTLPDRPVDVPDAFEDHARLMFDLQVLAFRADLTRVFTMLMGREASATAFPQIGLPEQHHSLSHHLNNPVLMAKKAKIDRHFLSMFAYFLEKLRTTPDGDGSLLDHSLLLYGGGLGNSNLHDHVNLPCLLVGGAGRLKGGRHLNYPAKTPMTNLFLNVLDRVGVPVPEKIGDSTMPLSDV